MPLRGCLYLFSFQVYHTSAAGGSINMYLNCHTYYSFKFGAMSIKNLLEEATAKGVHQFVLSDINNTSAIIEAHRLTTEYRDQYPIQPIAGIDFRFSKT